MNRKRQLALLFALLGAAGFGLVVYHLAGGGSGQAAKTVSIVVAARTLTAGTVIREGDLRTAQWVGAAPKGTTLAPLEALNRGVTSTIYEGEPVTANRLAAAGTGGGLAALIPHGMRACAVRVNEVVGVAGFVMPGMRVDVIISGRPPGDSTNDGASVRTLLQNIQVLSSGANIQRDTEGKPQQTPVVNLLVTPEQAEVLSLAGNETRIQLILRNPVDTQVSKPPGAAVASLFGQPARRRTPVAKVRPTPAPPPAPVRSIEVLNGAARTEVSFKPGPEAQ